MIKLLGSGEDWLHIVDRDCSLVDFWKDSGEGAEEMEVGRGFHSEMAKDEINVPITLSVFRDNRSETVRGKEE